VVRDTGKTIAFFVIIAVISHILSFTLSLIGDVVSTVFIVAVLVRSYKSGADKEWSFAIAFGILFVFDMFLENAFGDLGALFGILTAPVPPHPIFGVPYLIAIVIAFIVGFIRG